MAWTVARSLTVVSLVGIVACTDDGGAAGASNTDPGLPPTSSTGADTMDPATSTGSSGGSSATSNPSTTNPATTNPPDTGSTSTEGSTGTGSDSGPPGCGNGEVDEGEACDDGNEVEGDGCNSDCVESGTVLWSHAFASGNGNDVSRSVGLGDDGSAFVTGSSRVAEDPAAVIWMRRYSDIGAVDWTTTQAGPTADDDQGYGVYVDGSAVYVAGTRAASTATGPDIWTARLNAQTGGIDWSRNITGSPTSGGFPIPGTDRGFGVAQAADGNLVFAGSMTQTGQGQNAWIGILDDSGGDVSSLTINGASNSADRVHDVAIDGAGNIIVVGRQSNGNGGELWVRKSDPSGVEVWTRTEPGADSAVDEAHGVAVGPADEIYVAGAEGSDPIDVLWWVRKYAVSGNPIWTDSDAGEAGEGAAARGVVVLEDGDLVVVGHEREGGLFRLVTRRYSDDGTTRWTASFVPPGGGQSRGFDIAARPDGRTVVVGAVNFGVDGDDGWIAELAP